MPKIRAKYYNSIDDLPIRTFNKILSTGNVKLLVVEGNAPLAMLEQAWEFIYNEYMHEMGEPDEFKEWVRKKVKAGKLWEDVYVKGHTWKHSLAMIADHEANKLMAKDVSSDFDKSVAYMSQFYGFRIDSSVMSVREFLGYIKQMRNGK